MQVEFVFCTNRKLSFPRTRRIKCDETKPACKRCTLTGRDCAYEGGSLSPASSGPSSPPQPTSPTQGPTPPSWHVKEACEYCASISSFFVIFSRKIFHLSAPSGCWFRCRSGYPLRREMVANAE